MTNPINTYQTNINQFFNQWKESLINYYVELASFEGNLSSKVKNGEITKKDYDFILSCMISFEIRTHNKPLTLIKKLDVEFIKRENELKEKLSKKGMLINEIQDCYLTIGKDGSLNGWLKSENNQISINTILAGGYNIQKLHYRILIK